MGQLLDKQREIGYYSSQTVRQSDTRSRAMTRNPELARERIQTINRTIGQLNRHRLWRQERIEKLEQEKRELITGLPEMVRQQQLIWG